MLGNWNVCKWTPKRWTKKFLPEKKTHEEDEKKARVDAFMFFY